LPCRDQAAGKPALRTTRGVIEDVILRPSNVEPVFTSCCIVEYRSTQRIPR
jgi:hypothetical protein